MSLSPRPPIFRPMPRPTIRPSEPRRRYVAGSWPWQSPPSRAWRPPRTSVKNPISWKTFLNSRCPRTTAHLSPPSLSSSKGAPNWKRAMMPPTLRLPLPTPPSPRPPYFLQTPNPMPPPRKSRRRSVEVSWLRLSQPWNLSLPRRAPARNQISWKMFPAFL